MMLLLYPEHLTTEDPPPSPTPLPIMHPGYAYLERGISLFNEGEHEQAYVDMDQAIQMNPERAHYWRERGWLNLDRRALSEAVPDFDRVIEIDSQECLAYWGRALVYREQERYEATLEDLSSAIGICPTIGQLYVDRGWLYYDHLGNADRALGDFSIAIGTVPEDTNLYFQRGLLYDKLGMEAEARADFRHYLELTGSDPNADWHDQVQRWMAAHPE